MSRKKKLLKKLARLEKIRGHYLGMNRGMEVYGAPYYPLTLVDQLVMEARSILEEEKQDGLQESD